MVAKDRPLVWLHGEIKTPPFSAMARITAGELLRRLQRGETVNMPHSRPMPSLGARRHELRIADHNKTWRIVYRADRDAVLVLAVFQKTSQQTPRTVINICKRRIKRYDNESE